jgi:hypothetical protein
VVSVGAEAGFWPSQQLQPNLSQSIDRGSDFTSSKRDIHYGVQKCSTYRDGSGLRPCAYLCSAPSVVPYTKL